jgi:hypothetical protein
VASGWHPWSWHSSRALGSTLALLPEGEYRGLVRDGARVQPGTLATTTTPPSGTLSLGHRTKVRMKFSCGHMFAGPPCGQMVALLPLRAPARPGTLTRGTLSRGPRWHPYQTPPTQRSRLPTEDPQEPHPGHLPSWPTSNRGDPHPWHSYTQAPCAGSLPRPHTPTPGIRARAFRNPCLRSTAGGAGFGPHAQKTTRNRAT